MTIKPASVEQKATEAAQSIATKQEHNKKNQHFITGCMQFIIVTDSL